MTSCSHCTHSEKPLKFVMDVNTPDRKLWFSHPDSIDIHSELRGQATQLKYFTRKQTTLHGTSPFMGRGHSSFVDVESDLRTGTRSYKSKKEFSEKRYNTNDNEFSSMFFQNYIPVDTALRPESSRVSLRNSMANNNNHIQ